MSVDANAVRRFALAQHRPDSAIHKPAVIGDRPCADSVRMRLGHDKRSVVDDRHPVGKSHIAGDAAAGSIG
jgi:hypothetical protein